MAFTFQRSRYGFWRGWLAAFTGLLLLAALVPCTAKGHPPCNAGHCALLDAHADMAGPHCDVVSSVDCQLQNPQPVSADSSFAATLPSLTLLVRLAPLVLEPIDRSNLDHADTVARTAPAPLSLRPAVLLL